MRRLWSEDVASFHGEFASFEAVRVNPKPVRGRRIPVIVGGNSDAALGRVAAFGDGWYGFNLTAAAAAERIAALAGQCQRQGRSVSELSVAVALTDGDPGMRPELARAGVTELVIVRCPASGSSRSHPMDHRPGDPMGSRRAMTSERRHYGHP
jgi:alkanesulfonate monooxygenase SsuD/methylene tetrahydromethanopterin reductase-like flavin-dependent oxidoreductase (luciferase family)